MTILVKICGLSTPETLDVALDTGADMVGFAIFPPSPRNISFETARALGLRARCQCGGRPTQDATRPGGLGRPFDWHLLEGLDLPVPYMLSGGLDSNNVAEALRITRAPGVDVSSGVESAPGVKDAAKIRAFIRAARASASSSPLPNRTR